MTYGENKVNELLSELQKTKRYYAYREPKITRAKSAHQNPDFVVVAAALGVIVLEVKDWVHIREATQKQVEIRQTDNTIRIDTNPVITAEDYAHNLAHRFQEIDELLRSRHGRRVLKFPWMAAVVLPNINRKTIAKVVEGDVWKQGVVIGQEDLVDIEQFEKALLRIPRAWPLERPLSMNILDVIRGVLDPRVIIPDPSGQPIGVTTITQTALIEASLKQKSRTMQPSLLPDDFLSDNAVEVAQDSSVRLVRGVAGSGKSLVLARRAQFLAEKYPELNILVMAFNVDLVHDLERRIPGAANLKVINFHRICSQIFGKEWRDPLNTEGWLNNKFPDLLAQNKVSAEFVADEIEWRKELGLYDSNDYLTAKREGRDTRLIQSKREVINTIFDQYIEYQTKHNNWDWSDVPLTTLAMLQNDHPLRHTYDVILIDEAQDFAPSWVNVVKELLKPGGSLFLCDDPAQSLFRSFSWKSKGIEVVGRTRVLRVPFRCTREITLAAHSLLDQTATSSEEITTPDLTTYELASGEQPKLLCYPEMAQEIRLIEQQALALCSDGIDANQIAILCHNKRIVKHWAHLRNQGFYVDTFNRMKGLEFRAVFIPHLHTIFDHPDAARDEGFVNEVRRKVFTAMTRARETLVLTYHGDHFPAELSALETHVQYQNGADFRRAH